MKNDIKQLKTNYLKMKTEKVLPLIKNLQEAERIALKIYKAELNFSKLKEVDFILRYCKNAA